MIVDCNPTASENDATQRSCDVSVATTTKDEENAASSSHFNNETPGGTAPMPAVSENSTLHVVGDTIRITQVLRNLLSNALKFTKESGTIRVRVGRIPTNPAKALSRSFVLSDGRSVSYKNSGILYVEVIDDGAGLTNEQVSSLFQPNVQFNPNELQAGQGTGLGLYIAKGTFLGVLLFFLELFFFL
jgi:signal transduction histidine kinase